MTGENPNPTWSTKPGIIFRMTVYAHVVDEDNEIVVIPKGALLMTMGGLYLRFSGDATNLPC